MARWNVTLGQLLRLQATSALLSSFDTVIRRVYTSKSLHARKEMKDSNLRLFGRWICNKTWREILNRVAWEDKFDLFHEPVDPGGLISQSEHSLLNLVKAST